MLWLGERLHCGSSPEDNLGREEKGSLDEHWCAGFPSDVLCSSGSRVLSAGAKSRKLSTGRKQRNCSDGLLPTYTGTAGFQYSVYSCWGSALPTTTLPTSLPSPPAAALAPALIHRETQWTAELLLVLSSMDSLLLTESHTALPSHGPHALPLPVSLPGTCHNWPLVFRADLKTCEYDLLRPVGGGAGSFGPILIFCYFGLTWN